MKDDRENYQQIINKKKFDLFHIHDPFMPFLSYELLSKLDLPIVNTFHAAWEDDSFINIFNSFIPLFRDNFSQKIKGTIFVSKTTKKCWQKALHRRIESTIISNGIDNDLFKLQKKESSDQFRILFLARLVPRKGLIYLLQSLKKIIYKNENILLEIVGEGSDKKRAVNYVKKNKLEQYVKFIGYIDKEKKPDYYSQADIFCAPHINEGFGITLLEALSCGTPIVGFRNNAFSEVLKTIPIESY